MVPGKATLANLVTGIERGDAGHLERASGNLSVLFATAIARSGIARTFQTSQLPDELTVRQVVSTAAVNLGSTAPADKVVNGALALCKLSDDADTHCGTLPHGVRRRVEIARAIAGDPGVLVLDEPAAGLADEEQRQVADICRALAHTGTAILLIDHNLEFLRPSVTRLACMDAGRIIMEGPFDTVLADPAVRAAYFGMADQ
jgi:ABC-type branched-chain amino acid transport systems, ATPase component